MSSSQSKVVFATVNTTNVDGISAIEHTAIICTKEQAKYIKAVVDVFGYIEDPAHEPIVRMEGLD